MPAYEPCPYDEITLLDYVRGVTSYEIKLAIERSPACMAAARTLAEDMQVLTPMLRLALCPDVDTLIEYHEKRLPGAKQLVIHNHVQRCRQCQEELAMFTAIDEVPLQHGMIVIGHDGNHRCSLQKLKRLFCMEAIYPI